MAEIIVSTKKDLSLSEQEKAEIEHEKAVYPNKQAVGIEALRIVQRHRGWVSDDAVAAIANYLGLSEAEIDSVATFYNQIYRRPVGRQVIKLCDSVCCWIKGHESLKDQITEKLGIGWGETTNDNEFTLLPANCLGDCDRAPVLMINDKHYRDIDSMKLNRILDGLSPVE